jgi:glucose/arabinose dehydrogenase
MRNRVFATFSFVVSFSLIAFVAAGCSTAATHAKGAKHGAASTVAASTAAPGLKVPPGFHIQVYARGLDGPRFMAVAPNGDLIVSETDAGRVVAVPHALASPAVVASALTLPHGLAMRGSLLYVATWTGISRVQYPGGRVWIEVAGFPQNDDHYRRGLALGPDGNLYVSIGASCNVCDDVAPLASIQKELPGGALRSFATGLRNAEGLAFDDAGRLWTTVDQRDNIGPTQAVTDDLPPDEIDLVSQGDDFGWPSCYPDPHAPKRDPNPEYPGANCSQFTPATLNMRAHSSPLGMAFYYRTMFPAAYRGGAFVALHGSWDRREPVGDKVVYVKFASGKPVSYANFATGWLVNGKYSGRPTGIAIGRDGSLFISDDTGGVIYRVTYGP